MEASLQVGAAPLSSQPPSSQAKTTVSPQEGQAIRLPYLSQLCVAEEKLQVSVDKSLGLPFCIEPLLTRQRCYLRAASQGYQDRPHPAASRTLVLQGPKGPEDTSSAQCPAVEQSRHSEEAGCCPHG